MIVLHTMPRVGWGLLSPSPFCLKTELHLRMTGAPYELRPTLFANKAPAGKLPWIEDGGRAIADSEAIERHVRESRGDVLGEADVDAERRARAHLLRVRERWISDVPVP